MFSRLLQISLISNMTLTKILKIYLNTFLWFPNKFQLLIINYPWLPMHIKMKSITMLSIINNILWAMTTRCLNTINMIKWTRASLQCTTIKIYPSINKWPIKQSHFRIFTKGQPNKLKPLYHKACRNTTFQELKHSREFISIRMPSVRKTNTT